MEASKAVATSEEILSVDKVFEDGVAGFSTLVYWGKQMLLMSTTCAMIVLLQPPREQSNSTAGAEYAAFVEMIAAIQPQLEDFQCEFEGTNVVTGGSGKERLKVLEDGIAQRFSGQFIWTAQGDTYANILHRSEPDGAIVKEQLIIRKSKDEAEHYLRRDNAPLGRAVIDRPVRTNANRQGCLGTIFLIDTIKRYAMLNGLIFSVVDDDLDGQKVKILSISYASAMHPRDKFWIDLHRGGHVVRWEAFAPSGELTGRARIKLKAFAVESKSIWMPVSGVAESHNDFKDGKAYYPKDPTSVETIYILQDSLVFNKHPNAETFKIKYKFGTPISDNLRKLEYGFGQQKPEAKTTVSRAQAEKMLEDALAKAEEQKIELIVAPLATGGDWGWWLACGFGALTAIGTVTLFIQRRGR